MRLSLGQSLSAFCLAKLDHCLSPVGTTGLVVEVTGSRKQVSWEQKLS